MILWNSFLGLGDAIVNLLLLIDSVVYWFISELFSLYVSLAQAQIFNSKMYVDIANKVYLVMGVVSLFITAYAILQAIINPDNFKKNGADFVKKFLIGIIMVILTPSIFSFLYKIQEVVISDNIIPNLLLGSSVATPNDEPLRYFQVDPNAQKVDNEGNVSYDDELISNGEFKYYIQDTEKCKDLDYNKAIKKKECLVYPNQKTNQTLTEYGNYMGYIVLEGFLHPSSQNTEHTVVVPASEYFDAGNGIKWGLWGCVGGALVLVVGAAAAIYTGGASFLAALGTTGAGIAGCAGGALIGSGANAIAAAIDYTSYSWYMAKLEMVSIGEFDRITAFAPAVLDGRMDYLPIISTICGLVLAYMLLSYCIDLGIRAAKLAFYQLFAPVSFLLNTIPGQKDLLSNWIKVVLTTWGEVFIRIFTMVAAVYLISSLDMVVLEGFGWIAKAIIVMGIIAFVKQFPKLLGDLTGIKSENMSLGIMQKLGAGGALAAGALIGGGLTAGVRNVTNSWRNSKDQNLAKRIFSAAGSGIGGVASGGFRSAKGAGFKAKSWGDMKNAASVGAKAAHSKSQDRLAYKASHPGFGGVIEGHMTDAWSGIKNWAGAHGDIMDKVKYEDDYISSFDDYSALYENAGYKIMEEELNRRKARVIASGGDPAADAEVNRLELDLQKRRLDSISKNPNAAAYSAYNIAKQVQKNPTMAQAVGVSDEFIKHANDFVLKNNEVYHKDGTTKWTADDLHKLFEGVENTIDSSTGKYKKSNIYGSFEGLAKSKSEVRTHRNEDKNSIAYKEAKKAADKSNKN